MFRVSSKLPQFFESEHTLTHHLIIRNHFNLARSSLMTPKLDTMFKGCKHVDTGTNNICAFVFWNMACKNKHFSGDQAVIIIRPLVVFARRRGASRAKRSQPPTPTTDKQQPTSSNQPTSDNQHRPITNHQPQTTNTSNASNNSNSNRNINSNVDKDSDNDNGIDNDNDDDDHKQQQ
jgi:hypothetical protein